MLIAVSLAFSLASLWGVALSVGFWISAVAVLQRMGKADPMLRQVYMRHIRYRPFYPAKSGLFRRVCKRRPVEVVSLNLCTGADRLCTGFFRGGTECKDSEHRRKPRGLADLLLPYALIDDGILLQQDGSLLAGWSYRGPDMMSAAAAEMDALSARLNQCSASAPAGWCSATPFDLAHPDTRSMAPSRIPSARVIDDERRQQFMAEGAHFESEYFLTLTYLPPAEVEERAKGWLFEGRGAYDSAKTAAQHLERFRTKVDMFENVFGTLFQTERLKRSPSRTTSAKQHVHDRLLRYLRRCDQRPRSSVRAARDSRAI